MDINSFMSGNQSFNQSLYAPLTRDPLVCRPAVYFMRKVYMNRRPILRWVVSAGVAVQLAMLLCSAPLRAQTGMPSQPGSSSGTPFGSGSADSNFSTFDSEAKPETHVLSADHAPGDVYGVARYPSGLPMAGARVVILRRGCGRGAVHRQRRGRQLYLQETQTRPLSNERKDRRVRLRRGYGRRRNPWAERWF